MIFLFFHFSYCFFEEIWESNAPWKTALQMNDPYYLPVLPIFSRIKIRHHNGKEIMVFADLLSISDNILNPHNNSNNFSNFRSSKILHDLNNRVHP